MLGKVLFDLVRCMMKVVSFVHFNTFCLLNEGRGGGGKGVGIV